nr:DUF434 domain-containing protein [Candidatus Njordarchaeota archaeon]
MIITNYLVEAMKDLRYLLSRGYNRDGAVRFVGDKYGVTLGERYILMRCIFDEAEVENRRRKLVSIRDLNGEVVSIDGYNLLITVESILAKKMLVQCDDSIFRDISAVFGKHKITARTMRALRMILKNLKENNPKEVHFFYDKQVSKSGELASITRRMTNEFKLKGSATTALKSDIATVKSGGILVSGDSVVIQKAKRIFDLAGEIVRQTSYKNVVKLSTQGH